MRFDRTFTFLRRLSHWRWRHNLRPKFISAWDLCLYFHHAACAMQRYWRTRHEEILTSDRLWSPNCLLFPLVPFVYCSELELGPHPKILYLDRVFLCLISSTWSPLGFVQIVSGLVCIMFFAVLIFLLLPIIMQAIIWLTFLAGWMYFVCTASIWFLCFYITLPFWRQFDSMSSVLGLLSPGVLCVTHRATIRHMKFPTSNRSRSNSHTLPIAFR